MANYTRLFTLSFKILSFWTLVMQIYSPSGSSGYADFYKFFFFFFLKEERFSVLSFWLHHIYSALDPKDIHTLQSKEQCYHPHHAWAVLIYPE